LVRIWKEAAVSQFGELLAAIGPGLKFKLGTSVTGSRGAVHWIAKLDTLAVV
jgi:hypothetical protein